MRPSIRPGRIISQPTSDFPTLPDKLFRFRGFTREEYIKEELEAATMGMVRFSDPSKFNDPYDCVPAINPYSKRPAITLVEEYMSRGHCSKVDREMYIELKQRVDRGEELEAINIYIGSLMASLSSQIACACFVEDWQNIAMWNHYANEHSGVCLEFTRSDELERPLIGGIAMSQHGIKLNKVKYETTPFMYDLEDILSFHFDINGPLNQSNGKKFIDFIYNSFFRKSTHWEGENEWRALLNYRGDISDSNWYSVFPGYCLTKVIIGPLATDDRIAKIRKLCDESNIPVFRTIAHRINYGLSLFSAHLTANEAYRAVLDSGANEPRKG